MAEIDYSPKPLYFNRSGEHLLAVRYSEQNPPNCFFPEVNNGFNIYIGELNAAIKSRIERIRSFSIYQLVFAVIPLVFAVVHLLLFVFYPQFWNYLFYALSMLGFSVMAFTSFADPFVSSPSHIPWLMVTNISSINLAIAIAAGASFMRVCILTGSRLWDTGELDHGCAADLLRRRKELNAEHIKLFADVAHPITPECREHFQQQVMAAYEEELARSRQPGYAPASLAEDDAVDEDAGGRLAVDLARRADLGQHFARYVEHREHVAVPCARVKIEKHRARRVAGIGRVDRAAREVPEEP